MNEIKQVDKSHYEFQRYIDKGRWNSMWHQLDEVMQLKPDSVLEIGPGPGVFKYIAGLFNVNVETLDHDPELKPDHVGSATALPFADNTYDVVCAFQMLEHLPYADALNAFKGMVRVARRNVLISLPDSKKVWPHQFHIPKVGGFKGLMPRPFSKPVKHQFDGQHYWEINKLDFLLTKVLEDFSSVCRLEKTYRVFENPYHRFFIFSCKGLNSE